MPSLIFLRQLARNFNAAQLRRRKTESNNALGVDFNFFTYPKLHGMQINNMTTSGAASHVTRTMSTATSMSAKLPMRDHSSLIGSLPPTQQGEKPRVVVVGTGWAAARFMKDLDTKLYDIVCISPRNHMLFTPLLASTCVGTLEFRSVAEPIGNIQPALSKAPRSFFYLAECVSVDTDRSEVTCRVADGIRAPAPTGRVEEGEEGKEGQLQQQQQEGEEEEGRRGGRGGAVEFTVSYDKLVMAAGAQALTFNIHGVQEHATFLREMSDAQSIRRKILTNLMLSETPGLPLGERRRLLHCVVIGGGPTGVEFSGELSDFIHRDVKRKYSHVRDLVRVTLIEANEILSSFDVRLRQYASNHLQKSGVSLVRGVVREVFPDHLELSDGSRVEYGVLVWSTGVGPSAFVKSLGSFQKSSTGRIGVDEFLRVQRAEGGVQSDVFAIGDCAGYVASTNRAELPALAQVAERQGKYLARLMNRIGKAGMGKPTLTPQSMEELSMIGVKPFEYKHLGSMASVGGHKALVDLRETQSARGVSMAGFVSWLVWRSAYLTRVVSWRNRFYVAVNWATTLIFGRDISRI